MILMLVRDTPIGKCHTLFLPPSHLKLCHRLICFGKYCDTQDTKRHRLKPKEKGSAKKAELLNSSLEQFLQWSLLMEIHHPSLAAYCCLIFNGHIFCTASASLVLKYTFFIFQAHLANSAHLFFS